MKFKIALLLVLLIDFAVNVTCIILRWPTAQGAPDAAVQTAQDPALWKSSGVATDNHGVNWKVRTEPDGTLVASKINPSGLTDQQEFIITHVYLGYQLGRQGVGWEPYRAALVKNYQEMNAK